MSHQDLQGNSSNILCEIGDNQQFYKKSCLDDTCLFCDCFQLLSTCQHMDSTHAIGNEIVDYKKFKIVTYALKDGKQGKRCDLVIEKIPLYEFMKIIYEYAMLQARAIITPKHRSINAQYNH